MATSRVQVDPEYLDRADDAEFADRFARIEVRPATALSWGRYSTDLLPVCNSQAHYFVNAGFMRDGQLLEKASIDKIRHIPAVIIQGRYDSVCPAKTAWDLHRAWPEAKFVMVPDAGHSANEPGIEKALLEATAEFAKLP